MIAVKQNGSISVFKSNVRPFDSTYNVMLADYANKEEDSDMKEIIPLYEFTPSLNGKPLNANLKDGKFTCCSLLKVKSAFEHTTVAGIDNGQLLYLNFQVPSESNQK